MYSGGSSEVLEVSEAWRQTRDLSTTDPNISAAMQEEDHFCKLILYKEIKDSRVRIWDIVILVPNLLFLFFIMLRFNRARLKLRATSSPIFLAFYGLVICNVVISVIRCAVSMTVNAAAAVGGKTDKVLWVTVRFFLLSTEMSVVIFGLAFGHLDSRSSIRRVLIATSFIALAFTITQGTLELVLPDDTFHIPSRDLYVYGHGGMMFWFCSSIVFTLIYLFILILPWTRLRERLALPTRKSFYIYAGILALLDLVQSIGAGLLNYTQNPAGLCVVDVTAVLYLTCFTPLVYHTFLSEFFGVSQPSIMFSYKAQVDDAMEEDTVSLPHQQSFSSLKTDSDYIYQVHTPSIHMPLYDSDAPKSSASQQKASARQVVARSKRNRRSAASAAVIPANRFSSHMSPFSTSTGSKALGTRFCVQKSTSDLEHYFVKKTQTLGETELQSSTPELGAGACPPTSLVLSPSTASNFTFQPAENDSRANLFSRSNASGLESSNSDQPMTDQAAHVPDLESTLAPAYDSDSDGELKPFTERSPSDAPRKEGGLSEYLQSLGSSSKTRKHVEHDVDLQGNPSQSDRDASSVHSEPV